MVLANRLVATLRGIGYRCSAGWRALGSAPAVADGPGELTKGGDYVRLAVELASWPGTPV